MFCGPDCGESLLTGRVWYTGYQCAIMLKPQSCRGVRLKPGLCWWCTAELLRWAGGQGPNKSNGTQSINLCHHTNCSGVKQAGHPEDRTGSNFPKSLKRPLGTKVPWLQQSNSSNPSLRMIWTHKDTVKTTFLCCIIIINIVVVAVHHHLPISTVPL